MKKLLLGSLVALACLFSFLSLGKWALLDSDEAIYARVVHESLERKEWLSLTYLGQPWFEKPPLYFWLAGAKVAVLGESELSLRLVSAGTILLCLLLTWLITLRLTKSETSAFVAAAALLTTSLFVFAGRQVRLDVPVTAAILFSFYSFLKSEDNPRWHLGVGAGIALGVLTKSVVGLLALPAIGIYALVTRRWDWIRQGWFWAGIALAVALVAPWHIVMHLRHGQAFWDSYLLYHVLERARSAVTQGAQPGAWYHLKQLLITANPWLALFFAGIVWLAAQGKAALQEYRKETAVALIALFLLGLFFLPETRLLSYFVPALPFVAMAAGMLLPKALAQAPRAGAGLFIAALAVGTATTAYKIFSPKDRSLFLRPQQTVSRYAIAEDEKQIARIFQEEEVPLYVTNWNFFPTLLYYSNGNAKGLTLRKAPPGAVARPPYLVLIPTPLFKGLSQLPITPATDADARAIYSGPAGTLVKVEAAQ